MSKTFSLARQQEILFWVPGAGSRIIPGYSSTSKYWTIVKGIPGFLSRKGNEIPLQLGILKKIPRAFYTEIKNTRWYFPNVKGFHFPTR
jgi:hypothetical protein